MLFKKLLTSVALAASVVKAAELPEIEIVGNKFFFKDNGTQFLVRGVAYQQNTENTTDTDFVDPLADADACKRDIPYLEKLRTNVIRVYALDVDQDHTECMELLQEAGIYVVADLSQPKVSINRKDPEWNLELYDRYASVVDNFHNYTNVLGFFAGNEVTNDKTNTDASAYVKAAVRDTKAYIKAQGYRDIPVGYSANDDSDIRDYLADYFACGDDDEHADFFGINMYSWCGDSSYTESGYDTATELYENLGIPIFFSEYGCNEVTPREFTEVGTIFSSKMTDVWSGGIVYMYFQEENNYGLVSIKDGKVSTLKDFNYLSSEMADINPTLASADDVSSMTVTTCPGTAANWKASTNLPPTPDEEVCECMENSLSCVVDDEVDEDDYSDLFDYVCSYVECGGINGNGTTGEYGAYSPCEAKQKLSYVLNLYYLDHDSKSTACDFDGSASLKDDASTASSCSAYLKSAGSSGLGTVSGSIRTTKHNTGSSSNTDSSDSDDDSSSSSSGSSSDSTSTKDSASGKSVEMNAFTKLAMFATSLVFGAGLILA